MSSANPGPDRSPGPVDDEFLDGPGLVNASFAGTGVLAVGVAVGAVDPESLGGFTALVSITLFVIGVIAFLYGYAAGVVRSRDEKITLVGLFFLAGTAPRVVRFRLRVAFFSQVAVAVAGSVFRPYTRVAFSVLAPMLGLGLMSVWGARYGTFFGKDDDRPNPGSAR